MTTTYSTSHECGQAAGMKVISTGVYASTTTYPDLATIDLQRSLVYAQIVRVIGSGVSDIDSFAKSMEIVKVSNFIKNLRFPDRSRLEETLSTDDIKALEDKFTDSDNSAGFNQWIPGENE